MDSLLLNLRRSLRALRRRPGFTAIVVVTLGLGIGANAAVFSFAYALLLRPLPFREPDRLVEVRAVVDSKPGKMSAREVSELEREATAFTGFAAYYPSQYNMTGSGEPEAVLCTINTGNLFEILGVELLYGETWGPEVHRGIEYLVVLNHGLWKRLGADPTLVGKSITLDAASYRVLGVLPPGFDFPQKAELFRSITRWGDEELLDARRGMVVARLAEGVSLEAAQAELDRAAERLSREFPASSRGVAFELAPLRDAYLGEARPYLLLLLGAVAFVLLIACANVVNLLLARASGRSREISLMRALGAGRGRIASELLIESVLLSLAGGVVGLLLAFLSVQVLGSLVRVDLPFWMNVDVNRPVLLFTFALAVVAGIAAGLTPALSALGPPLAEGLREGSKESSGRRAGRLRAALVVTETALALLLLAGAGLTVKSLWRLSRLDLGFDPASVLTFRADPPWTRYYRREDTARFHVRALEEMESIPGVVAVAMNHNPPLAGHALPTETIRVQGQPFGEVEENPFVNLQIVSPNYFDVMNLTVSAGEGFTRFDDERSFPKAVVSRSLAERFWPGKDPIGKRFVLGERLTFADEDATDDLWITVVGVVNDVSHQEVRAEGSLDLYLSMLQFFAGDGYYLVRLRGPAPAGVADAFAAAIQRVDAEQSIFDVVPMESRIADRIWQQRLSGALLVAFGALALVLAAVGIYGVLSYTVGQRTRELGIRVALGAGRREILRDVLLGSMKLVGAGAALGLAGAFFVSRVLARLPIGFESADPALFVAAALLLGAVGAVASLLPARRATSLDPLSALRSE